MSARNPWRRPGWHPPARARIISALAAVGRPVTEAPTSVKSWGRAQIHTAPTHDGVVWIKHAYRLPPGEEAVLVALSTRWPAHLPRVVAHWDGAVVTDTLPGEPLTEESPLDDWAAAARVLGEIAAGEMAHAQDWLARGVRDRRPAAWPGALDALRASPVVCAMEPALLAGLDALLGDFESRYVDAFASPPTLVHQDAGCCNIHVVPRAKGTPGVVVFDWSDVVVGHAAFSCDRLLDQVPRERHDPVIEAFLDALPVSRAEFDAMRRSNIMHEVLRYHDELAYIDPAEPSHASLTRSVQSQIRVIVEHELAR